MRQKFSLVERLQPVDGTTKNKGMHIVCVLAGIGNFQIHDMQNDIVLIADAIDAMPVGKLLRSTDFRSGTGLPIPDFASFERAISGPVCIGALAVMGVTFFIDIIKADSRKLCPDISSLKYLHLKYKCKCHSLCLCISGMLLFMRIACLGGGPASLRLKGVCRYPQGVVRESCHV